MSPSSGLYSIHFTQRCHNTGEITFLGFGEVLQILNLLVLKIHNTRLLIFTNILQRLRVEQQTETGYTALRRSTLNFHHSLILFLLQLVWY